MGNPVRFSIVTVSYNNSETLLETIQSVLCQQFIDFEYWVIDGASTDGTLEILQSFGDKISWISEPDGGIYDAMNKGWKHAKGEFVAYLNADDFYDNPLVLSQMDEALRLKENVWAGYGDLAYVDFSNTHQIRRYWKSGTYIRDSFLSGWMPPHPTFFLKKAAFEQFGGFRNDELKSAADYELMLRMLYVNQLSAAYCPHLMVRMRTGGESNKNIKNRLRGNREDKKAWNLNHIEPGLFTFLLKPLRKIPQYWNRPKYN